MIEISCNNDRRYIKLADNDEFAFWLRSLGEFGAQGTKIKLAAERTVASDANTSSTATAPQADANQAPATRHIEESPGTQTDELSARYGI